MIKGLLFFPMPYTLVDMKQCATCKETKEETEFYNRNDGKPGSYCKSCHNARTSKWEKDNRQRKNDINRAWRKRNPERRKLMEFAGNALRGALLRGQITRGVVCEFCGSAVRIEAAHYDYGKPLLVKWLCISCHKTWDKQSPKTIS